MDPKVIAAEEERLRQTCNLVDHYVADRKHQLAAHDAKMKALSTERLEARDPREKDRLTEEIGRLAQHDPAKYLIPFEHPQAPYVAGLIIEDDDPKIGRRHILLGKQGLVVTRPGGGSQVVVTDWRKAEISKLYYEWEEGDAYEETVGKLERTGTIERKFAYGIQRRELLSLSSGLGDWRKSGGEWGGSEQRNATAERKELAGDHRMVDIISLISPEQFEMISRRHEGCFVILGGAGSGKTTVVLHRLSLLLFNHPQFYRPERCMVVMFNRSLRDYIQQTSRELLGRVAVETFHSWAPRALRAMGAAANFSAAEGKGLEALKKSARMHEALLDYAASSRGPAEPLADLGGFYAGRTRLQQFLGRSRAVETLVASGERLLSGEKTALAFDDAGILLRLLQLRRAGNSEVAEALGWYDHIVIDEAQDLSLTELSALTAATTARRSMSICADEKQRILDFVDGSGFASFQHTLKAQGHATGSLEVSYRSTAQIMALAARVSGRPATRVVNSGPDPRFHAFASQPEALEHLARAVRALRTKEPQGLTAIICRYKQEAEALYAALKPIDGVRLQTSALSYQPGVLITNAHQVKGLEFGSVLLWNPTRRGYPPTETGKNLLYVALTRASNRLAVYHYEPLTPLFDA